MALSDDRRAELFRGVLELVAERGYDKVTMDQVAERTHSSKATLYRQWGSKGRLVVEAIECLHKETSVSLPDTGTLRGDFRALVLARPRPEDDALPSDLVASLLPAIKSDPELAEAVRTDVVDALVGDLSTVVERAAARGEVEFDRRVVEHAALAFMAPFLLSQLLYGTEPDDDELLGFLDAVVLPALGLT